MGSKNTEFSLNKAQHKAVSITTGPALVVAGAGTGKTRVIVERILKLIADGAKPESILALTFTEKAAAEMQDRLNSAGRGVLLDITATTFNAFGHSLLETYGGEWGLGSIRLLGDTGQLVFLREHLDEFELDYFSPIATPDSQLEALASYASLLKQQVVTTDAYDDYAKQLPATSAAERLDKQKHQELARFYRRYQELCRQHLLIDYDDQLYLTIELLKARPNILAALQHRYTYVLVDEFQDTNPMQSVFVDLLVGSSQNIMVVGDDDQSIYGWRGATLANILDFKQRYPAAVDIPLTENFRSTQEILDSAYRLIQGNNPNRLEVINKLDKRLVAHDGHGPAPTIKHFASYEAELAWVAGDIQRRLDAGQAARSLAVLARRNQGVQKAHEALELQGVAHAVTGLANDIYAQPAVRQLIEALKTVADPLDSKALFHTLSGPLFSADMLQLAGLATQARREHVGLSEYITGSDNEIIKNAITQIEAWRSASAEQSVGTVAYNIITDSDWKQRLYEAAEQDESAFVEVQALSKFFKTLKEFERISSVPSVQAYALDLPSLQAAGSSFEDPTLDISDTLVNVLSIHRAKGLEWDTVYIVDCTEGSFPMRNFGGGLAVPAALRTSTTEADDRLAEERRLMYVAMTRAGRELTISFSDRHGSGAPRKPSRFLHELLGHEPDGDAATDTSQTTLELFSPRTASEAVALPSSMLRDGRLVLSVSQIVTWLRCPQDFYYRYVLNMPLPPAPRLGYGTLIHGLIEDIHKGRQAGKPPQFDPLLERVLADLPTAGYQTKRSRERAHAQAAKTVRTVYDRFMHDELPIETEWPFTLPLDDLNMDIRGKIDAVYALDGGVEIRDFKTGTNVTTTEQAKSRTQGSAQLTLYALAWQTLRGELPKQLGLDFVETSQYAPVRRQQKSLDTLQIKLQIMADQLRAGQYPAGQDHRYCMHPTEDA
jgi:DNA helicase-2/ATP-dependent DNA helicase PcrA